MCCDSRKKSKDESSLLLNNKREASERVEEIGSASFSDSQTSNTHRGRTSGVNSLSREFATTTESRSHLVLRSISPAWLHSKNEATGCCGARKRYEMTLAALCAARQTLARASPPPRNKKRLSRISARRLCAWREVRRRRHAARETNISPHLTRQLSPSTRLSQHISAHAALYNYKMLAFAVLLALRLSAMLWLAPFARLIQLSTCN